MPAVLKMPPGAGGKLSKTGLWIPDGMGPGGEPFFWRPERPVLGAKGELQLGGLFPSQREWWDLATGRGRP
jgi:hypothetical protein